MSLQYSACQHTVDIIIFLLWNFVINPATEKTHHESEHCRLLSIGTEYGIWKWNLHLNLNVVHSSSSNEQWTQWKKRTHRSQSSKPCDPFHLLWIILLVLFHLFFLYVHWIHCFHHSSLFTFRFTAEIHFHTQLFIVSLFFFFFCLYFIIIFAYMRCVNVSFSLCHPLTLPVHKHGLQNNLRCTSNIEYLLLVEAMY